MNIEANQNYTIIADAIDQSILKKLNDYTIISHNMSLNDLEEMIYNYPSKTIVFNDILRQYEPSEKEHIIHLLKERKVNFINLTSDMEEVLLTNYLIVFYQGEIAMEGQALDVLKEEKILKRLGFALPFAIDMAKQLELYQVINHSATNVAELVDLIWN